MHYFLSPSCLIFFKSIEESDQILKQGETIMPQKKLIPIFTILLLLTNMLPALANTSAYGPKTKRIGAGLYLGDPTGITLKGYLTKNIALDGVAAWSFVDDSFTLMTDATYDFFDIDFDTDVITVPFYAGGGAQLTFDDGKNNDTSATIHIPVGVAVQWVKQPVEIFVELSPGIQIAPETELDLSGGIGARFYF